MDGGNRFVEGGRVYKPKNGMHGTRYKYVNLKCRCDECLKWHSDEMKAYSKRRLEREYARGYEDGFKAGYKESVDKYNRPGVLEAPW